MDTKFTYGTEGFKILDLVHSEKISFEQFVNVLSNTMASNLALFKMLFGMEFINWIQWMSTDNTERFGKILANALEHAEDDHKSYMEKATTYANIAELREFLRTQVNLADTKRNFLEPAFFAHRVEMFIDIAIGKIEKW
jgi:hypothetical protein